MVTAESAKDGAAFARAWAHEALRVFYDRLVVAADQAWLLGVLKDIVRKHFGVEFDDLCAHLIEMHPGKAPAGPPAEGKTAPGVTTEHLRVLLWGEYQTGPPGSGALAPGVVKGYSEVRSTHLMAEKLELFLGDFNAISKKPMTSISMFLYYMEHVSRVARVLKMPGGHALLVGVGGSGRRSAATLASFICECTPASVELSKSYGVNEWRDDLKRILKDAGTGAVPVSFGASCSRALECWRDAQSDLTLPAPPSPPSPQSSPIRRLSGRACSRTSTRS